MTLTRDMVTTPKQSAAHEAQSGYPLDAALQVIGDRWSLQILRSILDGDRRFTDLQQSLGIARTVLASRLRSLEGAGLIESRRYVAARDWSEYRVTLPGLKLYPVIHGLERWATGAFGDDGSGQRPIPRWVGRPSAAGRRP